MTLKLSYILPFFLIVNTLGASCVQFDSIKTYRVNPSKKVEGTLQRLEKFPSNFITARNVDVWLPENFDNTTVEGAFHGAEVPFVFGDTFELLTAA